jgi:dUTP pyrophosphatase
MRFRLKVKQLTTLAKLPEYKTTGSVGMDIYSVESGIIRPGQRRAFRTGLAFEIPAGYEGNIRGRSGLAFKQGVFVIEGTVDQDYRGEVQVLVYNSTTDTFAVKEGDRIAQIVFSPVAIAELVPTLELGSTDRGTGGLGSTGI